MNWANDYESGAFDALRLEEQVDLVLHEGVHIGTTSHSIYRADLYQIGEIFVEVLLLPVAWDFVHVRTVNEERMEKYLHLIQLPELVG